MFSTGQLLFALLFIIGFTILTVWSYRKDRAKIQFILRECLGAGWVFNLYWIVIIFKKGVSS